MGHLTNSDSFRFGISSFWKQRTYVQAGAAHYFENFKRASQLEDFVRGFYDGPLFSEAGIIMSHVNVKLFGEYSKVVIYFYNGPAEEAFGQKRLGFLRKTNSFVSTDIELIGGLNEQVDLSIEKLLPHGNLSLVSANHGLGLQGEKLSLVNLFEQLPGYVQRFCLTSVCAAMLKNNAISKFLETQSLFYRNVNKELLPSTSLLLPDLRILANDDKVRLELCSIALGCVTAAIICRYVRVRLEQFDSFSEIVGPLARYVTRVVAFSGFLIRCAGRLTRQQRASFHEHKRGLTPFGTFSYPLDFAYDIAILKYGVASIRVWTSKGFDSVRKSGLTKWYVHIVGNTRIYEKA